MALLEDDFGKVATLVVHDAKKVGLIDNFRVGAVAEIHFYGTLEFIHFVECLLLVGEAVFVVSAFARAIVFKVYNVIVHIAKIVFFWLRIARFVKKCC